MEQYIPKSALVAEIKRLLAFYLKEIEDNKEDPWGMDIARRDILQEVLSFIDALEVKDMQEMPISGDLEEFALQYAGHHAPYDSCMQEVEDAVKAGAKWQKTHNWKPADGDDMPEYDREVIVLTQPYPLEGSEFAVSFAHRPNPDGWDGKSLTSGKVEHYTPKTYDKGGWNIPDVKYWLDIIFPNK